MIFHSNLFLFISTCFLWGLTWLAIHFQVQVVPVYYSVAYRFGIAGVLLLFYCALKNEKLKHTFKAHFILFLQGALLFSANFIFVYSSSAYLPSGLVAVIFSLILLMNMIQGRIFFKTPLSAPFIIGSILASTGLLIIFSKDIFAKLYQSGTLDHDILGILLCTTGTFFASLGNMLVVKVKRMQLPLISSTAYSMLYGCATSIMVGLMMHSPMTFDFSSEYILSLMYLGIGGSILGFLSYMTLIRNLGAATAAFVFVFTPLVAMILSTFFEGFYWEIQTYIGLGLMSLGQLLALSKGFNQRLNKMLVYVKNCIKSFFNKVCNSSESCSL